MRRPKISMERPSAGRGRSVNVSYRPWVCHGAFCIFATVFEVVCLRCPRGFPI